eukprot:TRINITY_DN1135_c0_g1_i2.p1 TRINITY_DN1135_c0_g1~~TRINITY_DN1135_c0_g1_i2.p1  ORF type:complete len:244 (+),score=32.32 TRINITY_DN1135_c0_g1_i2:163-894(+)
MALSQQPLALSLLLLLAVALLVTLTQAAGEDLYDKDEVLRLHNEEKTRWGLTSLYSWDFDLERSAQDVSDRCNWGHSGDDERLALYMGYSGKNQTEAKSVGENLAAAASSSGISSVDILGWINERTDWTCLSDSCAADKVCGHYTQMVRDISTRLGCGAKVCTAGNPFDTTKYDTWTILTCHYNIGYGGEVLGDQSDVCNYDSSITQESQTPIGNSPTSSSTRSAASLLLSVFLLGVSLTVLG